MKQVWPAAERNRAPILEVLQRVLPKTGRLLEIASGTGQHGAWCAPRLPGWSWQPTDADVDALPSIAAWRDEAGAPNLLPPLHLDVTGPWPVTEVDAVFCANMVHIAPWEAAVALLDGVSRVLTPEGVAVTYGPYRFGGDFGAPSNEAFDASLRARDPRWGLRDVKALDDVARGVGLIRVETVAMPANNHCLIWRRG